DAVADGAVAVADEADLPRQRHTVDGAPLVADRLPEMTARRLPLRHAAERDVVRRLEIDGTPELAGRQLRTTAPDVQQPAPRVRASWPRPAVAMRSRCSSESASRRIPSAFV